MNDEATVWMENVETVGDVDCGRGRSLVVYGVLTSFLRGVRRTYEGSVKRKLMPDDCKTDNWTPEGHTGRGTWCHSGPHRIIIGER